MMGVLEASSTHDDKALPRCRSSHAAVHVSALFDEPNLIADAGLLPLVALAEQVGLPGLAAQVRIEAADNSGGAHPAAKVMSLLGAMCSGADSIDDADRLRHGAMDRAFAGIRAPSTLGTFLRSFTHGHNRQLHRAHREFLARLAARTPLLPGAGQLMFIDIDPTHRRVYGRAEQGAEHGRLKGQRTLHPIVATLSTPLARPVIGAVRLRGQGRRCPRRAKLRRPGPGHREGRGRNRNPDGAGGQQVLHRRRGRRMPASRCPLLPDHGHESLRRRRDRPHHRGRLDSDPATPTRSWIPTPAIRAPDAEVAETEYTAFTGRKKAEQVTARLIVRRVRRLNPSSHRAGRSCSTPGATTPSSPTARSACFRPSCTTGNTPSWNRRSRTGSSSALAHLPSGKLPGERRLLTLWAMSHNLLRAAGALASAFHAKATTATLRAHLIHVPA